MPNLSNIQSPGVYINEINAFPNSLTPMASSDPDDSTSNETSDEVTPEATIAKNEQEGDLTNLVDNVEDMTLPQLSQQVWQDEDYYIQEAKYNGLNKFQTLNDDNQIIFPTTIQPDK